MSAQPKQTEITQLIGKIPYRMAFAGGWIDQPFISRLNPSPPGSMVVVGLEPTFRFMDRCGMGTSTRKVAEQIWPEGLPAGDPAELVRRLYWAENRDKEEPSGSQDMAGLVYPGINRLDYDISSEDGYFPCHVESCQNANVKSWLEESIHLIPVNQRPEAYNPLGTKNLDPEWVLRLGKSGQDCYSAILAKDLHGLGESMNECMCCWEMLLPHTVQHPSISIDLVEILRYYQSRYAGAMYSGCGGGYLYIVSNEPVPGSFQVKVRLAESRPDV